MRGDLFFAPGVGKVRDAASLPAAGSLVPTDSGNVAAQIKVDRNTSSCPSKGNLYVAFVAPDSAIENAASGPLRSVYVAVSADAALGAPTFTFTDHKVFTGSASAANIFPALFVDNFGNAYTGWSANQKILLSSASDLGNTRSS